MITFDTIPRSTRITFFVVAVLTDLAVRVFAWNMGAYDLVFGGQTFGEHLSFSVATGVAVPLVAAPLFLAPIAYIIGQFMVRTESNYVRYVSAVMMVASFIVFAVSPLMSTFAALLAYLILVSGMRR